MTRVTLPVLDFDHIKRYFVNGGKVLSSNMKDSFIKVYSTLNVTEAYVVKFLFENNGIETVIDNDDLNFFFGIVSAKDAMTDVWVPYDKYKKAADLLIEKSSIDLSLYEQITCPRCGKMNCCLFDYCWNCLANLKTGERENAKIVRFPRTIRKSRRSLYILIILISALLSGYLAYIYVHIH
jgi:hypothetical protein